MFVVSALKLSLLRLFTTHDAAGSRQIGGTEMKETRKVSSLISRFQAKRSIVKLVAAMCIHTPLVWTLWHDSSSAPSPHWNELPGAGNSVSEDTSPTAEEGTHVKVTANEVDIVLPHVSRKTLEKLGGCITFFGHNIVSVY